MSDSAVRSALWWVCLLLAPLVGVGSRAVAATDRAHRVRLGVADSHSHAAMHVPIAFALFIVAPALLWWVRRRHAPAAPG
jgi:hypothetical protein